MIFRALSIIPPPTSTKAPPQMILVSFWCVVSENDTEKTTISPKRSMKNPSALLMRQAFSLAFFSWVSILKQIINEE